MIGLLNHRQIGLFASIGFIPKFAANLSNTTMVSVRAIDSILNHCHSIL
jgi:hypothetical protein